MRGFDENIAKSNFNNRSTKYGNYPDISYKIVENYDLTKHLV